MVILIDTNILLDVLMKRSPFDKTSALVWKICETRKATGYISTLSYANIMYISGKIVLIKNRLNLGRRQRPSPFFTSNKNLAEDIRKDKKNTINR